VNAVPADLSVVICSLNGAAGVDRCLAALAAQQDVELEVIVVDDGSTDGTSAVAAEHEVTVLRHEVNRGLSAARNTGVRAATAPVVAFLDDDCEPSPGWAREVVGAYADGVIAVGGPAVPCAPAGYMFGFLQRNNPLAPLEMDLARSENLLYRLYRYAARQWSTAQPQGKREIYALLGANMSVRRAAAAVVAFDERFRFGADDLDFSLQLRRRFPEGRLLLAPGAVVRHNFKSSLRDTLRRSRAYGRGGARLYRKWPSMSPTLMPGPALVLAALVAAVFVPYLLAVAVALPQLMYPKGLRQAVTGRQPACLLDAYVQLAQETCGNAGYLQGLWQYRGLVPEQPATVAPGHAREELTGSVR
jgi:glycosyltransferase involved in cell wall biosynthesis